MFSYQKIVGVFKIHKIRGGKMMRPKVTQQNVHLFIPDKVSKICGQLIRDYNMTVNQAIAKVYASKVYETLSRESSKLWQEGWVYIYQLLKEEIDK